MSKVHGSGRPSDPSPVHKIAQLMTSPENGPRIERVNSTLTGFEKLPDPVLIAQKKAKRKSYSDVILAKLFYYSEALRGRDHYMTRSYQGAMLCCREIVSFVEDGLPKVKSKYCNHRVCQVCGSIRCAKAVQVYGPVIVGQMELGEEWFMVTLSRPNVSGSELSDEIDHHLAWFRRVTNSEIQKRKRGQYFVDLNGIRKIECTHNSGLRNHHLHMHILVRGSGAAEYLLFRWLSDNPTAHRKGSDITRVGGSFADLLEIFKYATKPVSKAGEGSRFDVALLDEFLVAMRGRRSFQAFGDLAKFKFDENDMSDLESQTELRELAVGIYRWQSAQFDWVHTETGDVFSGYVPSQDELKFRSLLEAGEIIMASPERVSEAAVDTGYEVAGVLLQKGYAKAMSDFLKLQQSKNS